MIRMRVRRQDRGYAPSHCSDDPFDVHEIVRPGVDDDTVLHADEVGIGARTGHEPGVARDQAAHARRDFVQLPRCQRHGSSIA